MNDIDSARIKTFEEIIGEANNLSCIARDSDLQQAAIKKLSELLATIKEWKQDAITGSDEDRANQCLGMECLARAIQGELNMWLLLKAEQPDKAWSKLVSAQSDTSHAIRAHKMFADVEGHARYLNAVEKIVFPPQRFLSAGLIVRRQICSICHSDYEDCSHLVGMPYWGEFCVRELMDAIPDHIAMVDDPANKECRITHFNAEGGKRNRMTWRIEPLTGPEQVVDGQKGLTVSAILMTKNDLVS